MPTFITAQDEHGPITARSADDTSVILDWEIPSTFIPCSVCGYNIDWLEFKQTITVLELCHFHQKQQTIDNPWDTTRGTRRFCKNGKGGCSNLMRKVLHNWWQQQEHWWHHNTKKSYYKPKHKHCEG